VQILTVSRGDSFISFNPSDTLKISCGVDHAKEAPVIGRQWFSWAPFEDDHYRWSIAPAKTFFKSMKVRRCLIHEVRQDKCKPLSSDGAIAERLLCHEK
jgi:UDP-3-O-acyl-N-acetylglucosamine deacetylase